MLIRGLRGEEELARMRTSGWGGKKKARKMWDPQGPSEDKTSKKR